MQITKFAVVAFVLAAVGAAMPNPEGPESLFRIGHEDEAPEDTSDSKQASESNTGDDDDHHDDGDDSSKNNNTDTKDDDSSDDDSSSKDDGKSTTDTNSTTDNEDDDDEELQTSTVFVDASTETVLDTDKCDIDDDDDDDSTSSDGVQPFVSIASLAIAGGVSVLLAAF
ncbi:hypothetical protein H4R24_001971 [Coemansia sp. RSA 988]|nr:hypothetical protein H4R24_001971 [Coemansia sp. RSA 988]